MRDEGRPADRRARDERDDGLVQLTTVEGSGVEVLRSEERLTVGVERVPWRRVRLVKRVVVERKVIELRREELVVEELPAGEELTADEQALALGRDAPLEIVLREEQAVVQTRVVPVERVRVWVDRVDGQRRVTVPLRHEEVALEQVPPGR